MKVNFHAGRHPGDGEKAVLPALVYVSGEDAAFKGFLIALGWWDWSVSVSVCWADK